MNIGKNIGPSLLRGINARGLAWHEAIGELCDNSLDAGASRVSVEFAKSKTLVVRDDGNGCQDIERMLTLGDHFKQSTTQVGRYGVGLKEAACWLWGELRINSIHKGVRRTAYVNWPALERQKTWELPDPIVSEANGRGTVLTFLNYTRKTPDYARLAEELGYRFAPALLSGRQIVIEGPRKQPFVCVPWRMPDLEQIIQETFEVRGKQVKLTAGIVQEGHRNPRPGFSFAHRHRIIDTSGMGSNGLSVARICGIVELDGKWQLGTNKTKIVDDDQDELADAIFARCEPILRKAATQAEVLRNSALQDAVTAELRMLLSNSKTAKAKRNGRANPSGRVQPTGQGSTHKRARRTQPGERFIERCRVGHIRMEWQDRDDDLLGQVDLPGDVIYMNANHPRLKRHRELENASAIADNALHMLAFEAIENEQSNRFDFAREREGFIAAVSCVLAAQQQTDEAVAAKAG